MFLHGAIDRFHCTYFCHRKRSSRRRSVRTKKEVKAVRKRIRRNPVRKRNILSWEMKISRRTMSSILKYDLRLADL